MKLLAPASLGAALFLITCVTPQLDAADLLFELSFEDGLKAGGSIADLVVTDRGGGLAESKQGKAWQFDGKSALEVAIPSRDVLSFGPQDQFTLQANIRLDEKRLSGALISKGTGAEFRLSVANDRTIGLSYYSQGKWQSYVSKDHPLPVFEWAEVTVQYDGIQGMVTFLIDGKLVGKFPIEAPLQSRTPASLFIGGNVNAESGETRGLSATIDDIRIYSGVKYPVAETADVGSLVYTSQKK